MGRTRGLLTGGSTTSGRNRQSSSSNLPSSTLRKRYGGRRPKVEETLMGYMAPWTGPSPGT
eukprot:1286507-Heterocapsa_arctica.AAC.1